MKAFLRRLFGKSKPKKDAAPPAPPKKKEAKPRQRTDSSFEPLEGRIAPAVLLNPSTVQYTDVDGDLVTVTFSKAIFTGPDALVQAQLDLAFKFKDSTQHVRTAANGGLATDVNELAQLDVTGLLLSGTTTNPAVGVNITIDAKPQGGMGNDLVNVGFIKAQTSQFTGIALGNVIVDGDLGQIDAGDVEKVMGMKSLTVQSLGLDGLASQLTGGSLASNVTGELGKLVIKGDMVDATLKASTGLPSISLGKIGSVFIGGKLRTSDGTTTASIAQITADNNIGSITIGTTADDGIIGGIGANTAMIKAGGKIGNIKITGDLRGGAGKDSGEINSTGNIGNVTITGDLWAGTDENGGRIVATGSIGLVSLGTLHGDTAFGTNGAGIAGKNAATIAASTSIAGFTTKGALLGGASDGSGSVTAGTTIAKVSIGTTIVGGAGIGSGKISAASMGTVLVTQTVTGGTGSTSGSIVTAGNLSSLTVKDVLGTGHGLVAGQGATSGAAHVGGNLGTALIVGGLDGLRNGELDGHTIDVNGTPVAQVAGLDAASVEAGGSIAKITVQGGLTGGVTLDAGTVTAGTTIGTLSVTGNLTGGTKQNTGSVVAGGRIASATIGGTLQGAAGDRSGALISGLDVDQNGDLTKAVVKGVLAGGGGIGSGGIQAGGRLVSLTVGVKGGNAAPPLLQGGTGGSSGSVFAELGVGLINILGSVAGAVGPNSGAIVASGTVTTVKIAGTLAGGTGAGSGSVQVHDLDLITSLRAGSLTSLTIGGAVTGSDGDGSGQILVEGSATRLTLGALTGGIGAESGSISVGGGQAAMVNNYVTIGVATSLTIKGALTGGTGAGSGSIDVAAHLGTVAIQGAASQGSVLAGRDLTKLTVSGAMDHETVSAQGKAKPTAKADLTIGSVTITGGVTDSTIRAGYDRFGNPTSGGAQIGKVSVTGDWTASNLVAGVDDVNGDGFGNADDVSVASAGPISKIAGIIITGKVSGTAAGGDHFGFTAQQIVSAKFAGVVQALTTGKDTLDLAGDPATNDLSIRETA